MYTGGNQDKEAEIILVRKPKKEENCYYMTNYYDIYKAGQFTSPPSPNQPQQRYIYRLLLPESKYYSMHVHPGYVFAWASPREVKIYRHMAPHRMFILRSRYGKEYTAITDSLKQFAYKEHAKKGVKDVSTVDMSIEKKLLSQFQKNELLIGFTASFSNKGKIIGLARGNFYLKDKEIKKQSIEFTSVPAAGESYDNKWLDLPYENVWMFPPDKQTNEFEFFVLRHRVPNNDGLIGQDCINEIVRFNPRTLTVEEDKGFLRYTCNTY